jgi:hypothetical protein
MKIIATLFIFTCLTIAPNQNKWVYTTYAEVTNKTGTLFTLEYGVMKKYNGYVKWKITNHTQMTVYDVGIANKEYTLSNGKIVKRSGESLTSTLKPGASKTNISDAVNSSENYGAWSDKNDNPVKSIRLKIPMIRFAAEKNGKRYAWSEAGTVKQK